MKDSLGLVAIKLTYVDYHTYCNIGPGNEELHLLDL